MEQFLFYLVSGVALCSAVYFVFAKNPLYSLLSLIVTFFSIAGLAIMVLFLYILMMLNLNNQDESRKKSINKFIGIIASGILFIGMLGAYRGLKTGAVAQDVDYSVGLTKNLGGLLFNEYVLPFELASILILAGIVGSVLIGKRDL